MNPAIAESLHGKLSPKESMDAEILREESTFSKVSNICRLLNEYLKYNNLSRVDKVGFVNNQGYFPKNYLIGNLKEMYIRSIAGHGTETKAVGILQSMGVIVNHESERVEDFFMSRQRREEQLSIEEKEDGVHVNLNNIVVYPKDIKHSPESPGYFNVSVVLSKDISVIKETKKVADSKLSELNN